MKVMQVFNEDDDIRVDIDDKFYVIQKGRSCRYVIKELKLPGNDILIIDTADTIGDCLEYLYHTQLRE